MEKIENLIKGFNTITMYRADMGYQRVYLSKDPVKIYSGLTGALDAITFKGNQDTRRLDGWRKTMIDNFGSQQTDAFVDSTAAFGTLCHEALVRIWQDHYLNWENEQEYAREYFKASAAKNNVVCNENVLQKQVFEFCKTAAGLMQFIFDEVKEIYAIEGMCKTDLYEIATPIDMVVLLNSGKVCTINLKTSSQLNDKHREQVLMERYMWNQTYPDLQAEQTALLRVKDWSMKKGIPTYEFEIVEGSLKTIHAKLALAKDSEKDSYLRFPKEQTVFSGVTKLGDKPTFETRKIEDTFFQEELA